MSHPSHARSLAFALGLALGAVACHAPAPTAVTEAAPPTPDLGAPAPAPDLRAALLARHPADLPGRRQLERVPEVEAALRALISGDEDAVVRARAADRLGLFDSDANAAFLLAVAQDAAQATTVRAAAVDGLARQTRRPATVEALVALVRGDELRVAVEAVEVLREVAPDALVPLRDAGLRPELAARLPR